MNWYYVEAGQQAGPVDDAALSALVSSGKITLDTLVWNESMPTWQPYSSVQPTGLRMSSTPSVPSAPPIVVDAPPIVGNEVVCAECGGLFPASETISYGNARVCAKCKPIFVQKLSEGVKVNTGAYGTFSTMSYAGFWIRFAAAFLDGIILGVIGLILNMAFGVGINGMTSGRNSVGDVLPVMLTMGLFALKIGIALSYQTFMVGKYGATVGKMACRIHVVTPEGGKVSYLRAFGRYFGTLLSSFTCLIGYIMAAFDDEKRALHDRICSTRVVFK
jgi:uncharacterized RDD family membrane protein YckC